MTRDVRDPRRVTSGACGGEVGHRLRATGPGRAPRTRVAQLTAGRVRHVRAGTSRRTNEPGGAGSQMHTGADALAPA